MASVSRSSKHLREQETSDGIFSSVAAHDAHTLTAEPVPTCARGEHTQQHVTLVLCGGDLVGKLWTGKAQSRKAQSRKALREDRMGLDDIRRKTAHRVPEEPTSDRHPSRRLRLGVRGASSLTFGDLVCSYSCPFETAPPTRTMSRLSQAPGPTFCICFTTCIFLSCHATDLDISYAREGLLAWHKD